MIDDSADGARVLLPIGAGLALSIGFHSRSGLPFLEV